MRASWRGSCPPSGSDRGNRAEMAAPSTQGRRQSNLVLILAREFASKLATATFVTDAEGNLVYYNEPAEHLLGRTFAEAGEVKADEWGSLYTVERPDGKPLPLEENPGRIALLERR